MSQANQIVFGVRDKAAEVALRRQLLAKERELKMQAKLKEQDDKLRRVEEQKVAELHRKAKLRAQRDLEKSKAVLDRKQAQLEADKNRKAEILQRAHQAASRTAQTSPSKVYAFGSSTPRELSYLERLTREQKTPPRVGTTTTTPKKSPVPSSMTTSCYVPRVAALKATVEPKATPVKPAVSRRSPTVAPAPSRPKVDRMSASMYVPPTRQSLGSARTRREEPKKTMAPSKPLPAPRRSMAPKPPLPKAAPKEASVPKSSVIAALSVPKKIVSKKALVSKAPEVSAEKTEETEAVVAAAVVEDLVKATEKSIAEETVQEVVPNAADPADELVAQMDSLNLNDKSVSEEPVIIADHTDVVEFVNVPEPEVRESSVTDEPIVEVMPVVAEIVSEEPQHIVNEQIPEEVILDVASDVPRESLETAPEVDEIVAEESLESASDVPVIETANNESRQLETDRPPIDDEDSGNVESVSELSNDDTIEDASSDTVYHHEIEHPVTTNNAVSSAPFVNLDFVESSTPLFKQDSPVTSDSDAPVDPAIAHVIAPPMVDVAESTPNGSDETPSKSLDTFVEIPHFQESIAAESTANHLTNSVETLDNIEPQTNGHRTSSPDSTASSTKGSSDAENVPVSDNRSDIKARLSALMSKVRDPNPSSPSSTATPKKAFDGRALAQAMLEERRNGNGGSPTSGSTSEEAPGQSDPSSVTVLKNLSLSEEFAVAGEKQRSMLDVLPGQVYDDEHAAGKRTPPEDPAHVIL